jgi:uncharacterized protein
LKAPKPPPERAMDVLELDHWLRARLRRLPLARNVVMLDGFVAAVVAGPVSMDPRAWICPLLAIPPDAFNTGGTPEFAAIAAVSKRHNEISDALVEKDTFAPLYSNGLSPPSPAHWAEGFFANIRLNQKQWKTVLDPTSVFADLLDPLVSALDNPDVGAQASQSAALAIPGAVSDLRKNFQLKRYGKPHYNSPRRS